MARFLSSAWFDELARAPSNHGVTASDVDPGLEDLVIQQVVLDTPDGDVRYWVRIHGRQARVAPGHTEDSDVTFTEDYATASAIARGELTTQAALLAGRIRVSGSLAALAARHEGMGGIDPLPAVVRAATTF